MLKKSDDEFLLIAHSYSFIRVEVFPYVIIKQDLQTQIKSNLIQSITLVECIQNSISKGEVLNDKKKFPNILQISFQ